MGKRAKGQRSSATDKVKGKAKEMAGKLTGDRRLEREGRTEHVRGKAKEAVQEAKERVAGAKDAMSRKGRRHS